MSSKSKVLLTLGVLIVSFAAGRYSVPKKIVETETKVVDESKVIDKDVKKVTKTKTTTNKDGTTSTETEIVEERKTKVKQDTKLDESKHKEIVAGGSTLNVSLLAGTSLNSISPIYGIAATKQVLGPISVGAWGLHNKTVGLSIGLAF